MADTETPETDVFPTLPAPADGERLDSLNRVRAAVALLRESGIKASARKVRTCCGGGDLKEVLKHIHAVEDEERAAAAAPPPAGERPAGGDDNTTEPADEVDLPADLTALLEALPRIVRQFRLDGVAAEHRAHADIQRAEREAHEAAVRNTTEQWGSRLEALKRTSDGQVEAARVNASDLAETVTATERERDDHKARADRLEAEAVSTSELLSSLNEQLAAAQAAERTALAERDSWRQRYYDTLGETSAAERRAVTAEAMRDALQAQVNNLNALVERLAQRPAPSAEQADTAAPAEPAAEAVEEPAAAPKQRRRPWTEADDAALRSIAQRGGTQADAVRELGRPDGIVSEKWRTLGLPVPPRKGRSMKRHGEAPETEDRGPPLPLDDLLDDLRRIADDGGEG